MPQTSLLASRDRDEGGGRQQAALRMVPAHQRLVAARSRRCQLDDRLEMQHEFLARWRARSRVRARFPAPALSPASSRRRLSSHSPGRSVERRRRQQHVEEHPQDGAPPSSRRARLSGLIANRRQSVVAVAVAERGPPSSIAIAEDLRCAEQRELPGAALVGDPDPHFAFLDQVGAGAGSPRWKCRFRPEHRRCQIRNACRGPVPAGMRRILRRGGLRKA